MERNREEELQIMTEYVEAALQVITSGKVPECTCADRGDNGVCFDCAYREQRKCTN